MQVKCTIPVAVSIILSLKWGILCAEEHQFYFLFQWAWSFFFVVAIECFIVGTANDNEVYIYMLNWGTITHDKHLICELKYGTEIQIMVIALYSQTERVPSIAAVFPHWIATAASCRDLGFWNHFSSRTHSGTFLVRNYQPGLCWSKRRREKHRSNYRVSARKAFPHLAYHNPAPTTHHQPYSGNISHVCMFRISCRKSDCRCCIWLIEKAQWEPSKNVCIYAVDQTMI